MKLRNLLFGTMIACAFAACSNEDDPIVGPDQPQTGENNATLTISVKNAARSLTKAAAASAASMVSRSASCALPSASTAAAAQS